MMSLFILICQFAGYVMQRAVSLKEEGKISHALRWGGDWNQNTHIKDEDFKDFGHFELILP